MLLGVTACHCQMMKPSQAGLCIPCIRGDMSFLASDELQGRGSGTRDEHLAALYAASLFAGFGSGAGRRSRQLPAKGAAALYLCRPRSPAAWQGLPRCQERRRGTSWAFCAAPIQSPAKTRSC